MRKAITLAIIALLSMVLVGCAMQEIRPARDEGMPSPAADSPLQSQDTSADAQEGADEMSDDLAEIDALNDDLTELEGLQDELDFDLE